ncbi:prephenate dehydrogenase/arogenate dehydrogenase family protein [Streptomyces hawaiiensis]|uniref:prephenate dehydrogenase/arogenate dehydrogenase family protein n=1 Tax=Streptomyces hawaiiensis TaxID=67305 RepID=UPI003651862B
MIRTMAIVGTGLIGTSVGLAAARHGVTVHLRDTDVAAARAAAALGAGVLEHPEGPVDPAVPPSHVGTILAQEQRRGPARSFRDVASVKAGPVAGALRHAAGPASCISGHPPAGRERSGPLAARAGSLTGQHGC